jgi:hypothetical protein
MKLDLKLSKSQISALAIIFVLLAVGIFLSESNKRRSIGIERAFAKVEEARTMHAKGQLTIRLPEQLDGRDRPFTNVSMEIAGDIKRSDNNVPELSGNLFAKASGRGNIFFADGEVVLLTNEVLFNLSELPTLLNPTGSLINKWTQVNVGTLNTSNSEQIRDAFVSIARAVRYAGRDSIDGERTIRYSGTISQEHEQLLADAFRFRYSNNRSLHIIARLLDAADVDSVEIWTTGQHELRRVNANFAIPLRDGSKFDFVKLTLTLSDYGKDIAIEIPTYQLTVKPDVFTTIFGTGQVEVVK